MEIGGKAIMTEVDQIVNAYIYESKRTTDGDPLRKYRATLPNGTMSYHPTKAGAAEAILKACGLVAWHREEMTGS
jgi:hypothetical protein